MKSKVSLKERLKVCRYVLVGEENPPEMLQVTCHYCKSWNIKFQKAMETENEYHSTYTCVKCGATARNIEIWNK